VPLALPRGPRSALAVGLLPLRRLPGPPSRQVVPVPPGANAEAMAGLLRRVASFPVAARVVDGGGAVEVARSGCTAGWTVA
jgi:hypothetical protein